MKWITNTLIIIFFFTSTFCLGQNNNKNDSTYVNKLIDSSKSFLSSDTTKAISLANQAIVIAKKIKYPKGEAYALKNLGMVYYVQSEWPETINYWENSLKIFEEINDEVGMANLLNNIAAIYFNQGADAKALEYSLKSLQIAESIQDNLRILSALTTIGSIYHNKKDPVALDYLLKALPLSEGSGNTASYIVISGDIGEIYYDKNEDAKALEYFQKSLKASEEEASAAFAYNGIGKVYLRQGKFNEAYQNHLKALKISEKLDDKLQVIRSLRGLGDVYNAEGKKDIALEYYNRAKVIAEETNTQVEMKDIYQVLASTYSEKKDFSNAFLYQSKYAEMQDSFFKEETAKKIGQLAFNFDLSQKQGEVDLKESEVKAQRNAKTGLAFGLGLILIISIIIYRNYLNKAKINKILDKQKDEIENLLLNILPAKVATELKETGESKPRHLEDVSVLFTDFKGFTAIADKMDPTELVKELNECFVAFDDIISSFGLEKIKTIGDSYMCAGNIPSPLPDHSYKIIKAGLAIQAFMDQYNERRKKANLELWEVRIGVHIGPVVAGVVGKKKYAYDIWGGTVNIASRMESNGGPGRVNISSKTYDLIKDRFACSYRGKINAKNLGEIDMYFVEHEIVNESKEANLVS